MVCPVSPYSALGQVYRQDLPVFWGFSVLRETPQASDHHKTRRRSSRDEWSRYGKTSASCCWEENIIERLITCTLMTALWCSVLHPTDWLWLHIPQTPAVRDTWMSWKLPSPVWLIFLSRSVVLPGFKAVLSSLPPPAACLGESLDRNDTG